MLHTALSDPSIRAAQNGCACVLCVLLAVTCVLCIIVILVVVVKQPFGNFIQFFLCFFLGCTQFCTFWYYMLSYIPFGRKGARKLCDALVKKVST